MAATSALLLLLLAPFVVREPVGREGWERDRDPLHHRIGALLAGEPVVEGSVTIVPLYARVPSEACWEGGGEPRLASGPLRGRLVRERNRFYLRLANPGSAPLLVAAGTVFALGEGEVYLAHDAIVPAHFAALLPVRAQAGPFPAAGSPLAKLGILPPLSSGAILMDRDALAGQAIARWRRIGNAARFRALLARPEVRRLRQGLERRARRLGIADSPTLVGAVFLVGNRPVAAHLFATRELFAAALPDLLAGLAVQARLATIEAGGIGPLALRAAQGDARGRSLVFLRGMLASKGAWSESYGEGFEILVRNARDGAIGHAVVTQRHRVVHAAFLMLGEWWRDGRGGFMPPGPGAGPRPPAGGGSETAPGEIDRKARPSLSEARERPRRPGPPPPR